MMERNISFQDEVGYVLQEAEKEKLSDDIKSLVGSATLSLETLKVVQYFTKKKDVKTIIEFGSGVSTALLANLSEQGKSKAQVSSFESSLGYWESTCALFSKNESIRVIRAPIKVRRFFGKPLFCYDPQMVKAEINRRQIDLVIIDGPKAWLFGREATLYQIAANVTEDTWILLDDACREHEEFFMRQWEKVFSKTLQISTIREFKNGLAFLKFKKRPQRIWFPFTIKEIKQAKNFIKGVHETSWKQKYVGDNV